MEMGDFFPKYKNVPLIPTILYDDENTSQQPFLLVLKSFVHLRLRSIVLIDVEERVHQKQNGIHFQINIRMLVFYLSNNNTFQFETFEKGKYS